MHACMPCMHACMHAYSTHTVHTYICASEGIPERGATSSKALWHTLKPPNILALRCVWLITETTLVDQILIKFRLFLELALILSRPREYPPKQIQIDIDINLAFLKCLPSCRDSSSVVDSGRWKFQGSDRNSRNSGAACFGITTRGGSCWKTCCERVGVLAKIFFPKDIFAEVFEAMDGVWWDWGQCEKTYWSYLSCIFIEVGDKG